MGDSQIELPDCVLVEGSCRTGTSVDDLVDDAVLIFVHSPLVDVVFGHVAHLFAQFEFIHWPKTHLIKINKGTLKLEFRLMYVPKCQRF